MTILMESRLEDGISIGFFGTFFPESGFAGNSSTGIVRALKFEQKIKTLLVFSQAGSHLPRALESSKVLLLPCWSHDRPLSLLLAVHKMLKHSPTLDGFLFNVYLTAFGRTALANSVGLLMPPLIAMLSRKPVVVYMHNLLETQDVLQLGYRPTIWQRLGVQFLERLLLRSTRVIVPLKSQQEQVAHTFRTIARTVPLPFVEPFGLLAASERPPKNLATSPDEPTRILLLGRWGPQKDLSGVLHVLQVAHDHGGRFVVTVTGAINAQFPQSKREISQAVASMDPEWFRFLGFVPEAELLDMVLNHDLLILPYNATGGYSGLMSVGAYCGIGIIAYDLPQLRETADELGIHPSFVQKGDIETIVNEILSFCAGVRRFRASRPPVPRPEYDARVRESANRLIDALRSTGAS